MGSANQTYMENPDCILPQDWDESVDGEFRCPDAGKVDLILVSKKAKHIGNDAHAFLDAEGYLWEDYAPEDGIGDDPADFEEGDVAGIDRGCELLGEALTCPCWNTFTEVELVAALSVPGVSGSDCIYDYVSDVNAYILSQDIYVGVNISAVASPGPQLAACSFGAPGLPFAYIQSPPASASSLSACVPEAVSVVNLLPWCTPD